MSGRKLSDHSSWMGSKGKDMVMPEGCKTKSMDSAEGAGSLMEYKDTAETIKSQQVASVAKAKGHAMKPGYRN